MVHIVYPFFAKMPTGTVIHGYLNHPFLGIELLIAIERRPSIHHSTCVGTAVNAHQNGVFFVFIHVDRPGNFHRQIVQAIVAFYPNHFCFGQFVLVKFWPFAIPELFDDFTSNGTHQCTAGGCGSITIIAYKISRIWRKANNVVRVIAKAQSLHFFAIQTHFVKIYMGSVFPASCSKINDAIFFVYLGDPRNGILTFRDGVDECAIHVVVIQMIPTSGIAL